MSRSGGKKHRWANILQKNRGETQESTEKRDQSRHYLLSIHNTDSSQEDILLNGNLFKAIQAGDVMELTVSDLDGTKFGVKVGQKSIQDGKTQLEVSLTKSLCDLYGLNSKMAVILRESSIEEYAVDMVALTLRNEYVTRRDMKLVMDSLKGELVHRNKIINSYGQLKFRVKEIFHRGNKKVNTGFITSKTTFSFCTKSAQCYWVIELTTDLWHYDNHFYLLYHRVIRFIRLAFAQFFKNSVSHQIHILVMAKLYFPNLDKSDINNIRENYELKLHCDSKERVYQQIYHKICSIEKYKYTDYQQIISYLRRFFILFPSLINWYYKRPEFTYFKPEKYTFFPKGSEEFQTELASSEEVDILEIINICMSALGTQANDLSLNYTGQQILILSGGRGVYDASKRVARVTKNMLAKSQTSCDIFSFQLQPLHVAPLFIYKGENTIGKTDTFHFSPFRVKNKSSTATKGLLGRGQTLGASKDEDEEGGSPKKSPGLIKMEKIGTHNRMNLYKLGDENKKRIQKEDKYGFPYWINMHFMDERELNIKDSVCNSESVKLVSHKSARFLEDPEQFISSYLIDSIKEPSKSRELEDSDYDLFSNEIAISQPIVRLKIDLSEHISDDEKEYRNRLNFEHSKHDQDVFNLSHNMYETGASKKGVRAKRAGTGQFGIDRIHTANSLLHIGKLPSKKYIESPSKVYKEMTTTQDQESTPRRNSIPSIIHSARSMLGISDNSMEDAPILDEFENLLSPPSPQENIQLIDTNTELTSSRRISNTRMDFTPGMGTRGIGYYAMGNDPFQEIKTLTINPKLIPKAEFNPFQKFRMGVKGMRSKYIEGKELWDKSHFTFNNSWLVNKRKKRYKIWGYLMELPLMPMHTNYAPNDIYNTKEYQNDWQNIICQQENPFFRGNVHDLLAELILHKLYLGFQFVKANLGYHPKSNPILQGAGASHALALAHTYNLIHIENDDIRVDKKWKTSKQILNETDPNKMEQLVYEYLLYEPQNKGLVGKSLRVELESFITKDTLFDDLLTHSIDGNHFLPEDIKKTFPHVSYMLCPSSKGLDHKIHTLDFNNLEKSYQDWFTEQLELIGENIKKDVESFLIEMKEILKKKSCFEGENVTVPFNPEWDNVPFGFDINKTEQPEKLIMYIIGKIHGFNQHLIMVYDHNIFPFRGFNFRISWHQGSGPFVHDLIQTLHKAKSADSRLSLIPFPRDSKFPFEQKLTIYFIPQIRDTLDRLFLFEPFDYIIYSIDQNTKYYIKSNGHSFLKVENNYLVWNSNENMQKGELPEERVKSSDFELIDTVVNAAEIIHSLIDEVAHRQNIEFDSPTMVRYVSLYTEEEE